MMRRRKKIRRKRKTTGNYKVFRDFEEMQRFIRCLQQKRKGKSCEWYRCDRGWLLYWE